MKKKSILAALAFTFVLFALIGAVLMGKPQQKIRQTILKEPSADFSVSSSANHLKKSMNGALMSSMGTSTGPVGAKQKLKLSERGESFKERFGGELKFEWGESGRLVSIRGSSASVSAGADYRSDDPQSAISRAKDILEAAGVLLGVQSGLPLENPIAIANAASAQVYFQETLGGVPLAPLGKVTVDLGPKGELLGLDSSYMPNIAPKNAVDSKNMSGSQSKLIVWVSSNRDGEGRATSRYAYDSMVNGLEVVTDATTGESLFRRDRRVF